MFATSTGGTVTGFRGERLCIASGSNVSTESGYIDIDVLHTLKSPPRILTWNHLEGRYEFKKLQASSRRPSEKRIVAVQTVRGSRLECTEDHRVFTVESGYREAGLLQNETLIINGPVQSEKDSSIQDPLLQMREAGYSPTMPACESNRSPRYKGLLLFKVMLFEVFATKADKALRNLWEAVTGSVLKVLRTILLDKQEEDSRLTVPYLCGCISSSRHPDAVLLSPLCESRALSKDDGNWKLQVYNGEKSRQPSIQEDVEACTEAGRKFMRCVREEERACSAQPDYKIQIDSCDSPYRREPIKQHTSESSRSLPQPSYGPSQIQTDSVSLVEFVRGPGEFVYDLTVEGNHNFFANGILVHNCLDDPHDPQGAESEVQRETTKDWLSLTWPTRLNDTALSAEVLVMQRLHETDATGLYLSEGGWEHLKIPMYFRGTKYGTSLGQFDPRTSNGEIIDSRVYSQEYVDRVAKRLGPYGVAGQFQQEPAPPEGGIIKRAWLREYRKVEDRLDVGDYLIDWKNCLRFCTVDPAVTKKETSDKSTDPDYTVMLAWAVFFSTRGPLLILLDAIRERLEGPDIIPKLEAFDRFYSFSLIGVETVAFQMMLFQEAKRKGLPVREIANKDSEDVIYRIDKDKVARAYAATPMMADGRFYVPNYAPWLEAYVKELTTFPNAAHDDYVDATSAGCAIAEKMNRESALDIASRRPNDRIRDDGINNLEEISGSEDRSPWDSIRVRRPGSR